MSLDWIEVGEVCQFLDSRRVPVTESDRKPGPYPYYGANGQQGWIDGYIFDEPLVLLAEDGGSFGSKTKPIAYKVIGKCWVNNHAHVLRPDARCDVDYLRHILSFYDVTKFVNGTTRQKLNKSEAERIPIPLPPLPEQRRIAGVLDRADRLRRMRRYARQMGETFLQAVFVRMFGDPMKNALGWEKTTLGHISNQITDGTHVTPTYMEAGVPFISTVHVSEQGIDWSNAKRISQDEYETLNRRVNPQVGDILYTKVGSVGLAVPVLENIPFSIFVQLALIKLKQEKCNFRFLAQQLNFPSFRNGVVARLAGATMNFIGVGDIGYLEIIAPPLALQGKFARVAQQFDRLRAKQREAERQAEQLFQALLQRAFSGEL